MVPASAPAMTHATMMDTKPIASRMRPAAIASPKRDAPESRCTSPSAQVTDYSRSVAPKRSRRIATIASFEALASSSVMVASGFLKVTVNAMLFFPAPICGPWYSSNARTLSQYGVPLDRMAFMKSPRGNAGVDDHRDVALGRRELRQWSILNHGLVLRDIFKIQRKRIRRLRQLECAREFRVHASELGDDAIPRTQAPRPHPDENTRARVARSKVRPV